LDGSLVEIVQWMVENGQRARRREPQAH